MTDRDWNEHYASGFIPWDTGAADPMLIDFVERGRVAAGRTLEVGCGTGTNAMWLAERGFDVLGIDVAPLAIERAREALAGRALSCRFEPADFLAGEIPGPFDFVFDRGCFHVFDEAEQRARFAERVAAVLAPGGQWLSLIGSTEGPPRDVGPPRRSAREVIVAIEPHLEILELRGDAFTSPDMTANAWVCVARRRTIPAQPSTRH